MGIHHSLPFTAYRLPFIFPGICFRIFTVIYFSCCLFCIMRHRLGNGFIVEMNNITIVFPMYTPFFILSFIFLFLMYLNAIKTPF